MTDNPCKITEAKPVEPKPYGLLGLYALASDTERQLIVRTAKRLLAESLADGTYPNMKGHRHVDETSS